MITVGIDVTTGVGNKQAVFSAYVRRIRQSYIRPDVSFASGRPVHVLDPDVLDVPVVHHHVPRVAVQSVRPVVVTLRHDHRDLPSHTFRSRPTG